MVANRHFKTREFLLQKVQGYAGHYQDYPVQDVWEDWEKHPNIGVGEHFQGYSAYRKQRRCSDKLL